MKNKKGFTLIELLAVIVILAIIALITVPQILKLLNQARISAAEDTTYGIYNATQDYISKVLLSNGGDYPNIDLTFTCDATSCKLDNYASLSSEYNLEETLDYKGTKAKEGKIKISSNGSNIIIENLKVNEFYCNHNGDRAKCEKEKSNIKIVVDSGYSVYDKTNGDLTDIAIGKYGYVVTGKPVYFKYPLTNGSVVEGTLPELCIYSENYGGELCLTINEYDISKPKILNYFGYDSSTWTFDGEIWKHQDIECNVDSVECKDSLLSTSADGYGYVYASDISENIICEFSYDGQYWCWEQTY